MLRAIPLDNEVALELQTVTSPAAAAKATSVARSVAKPERDVASTVNHGRCEPAVMRVPMLTDSAAGRCGAALPGLSITGVP